MDENTFWQLIDKTRVESNNDGPKQAELLGMALKNLQSDDVISFNRIMQTLMDTAYQGNLWDAAYLIGCGCSDDGFMDFRAWLIGQGKQVYENALADPETLVDIVNIGQETQIQDIWAIPMLVYEDMTGEELPYTPSNKPELIARTYSDEENRAKFPKLSQKFGDCFG